MLTESKSYIFLIAQSIILLILMIVAVSSVDGGWTEIFQCQIYTSNWNNQPDSRTITVEGKYDLGFWSLYLKQFAL